MESTAERLARLRREGAELAREAPELTARQLDRLRILLRPRVPRPAPRRKSE